MRVKQFIPFLLLILYIQTASAGSIIITEVLYDPLSETGSEYVQLYNPTLLPVDISNWNLASETSLQDVTIPTGTVISPNSYYLIADANWSTLKDNASWPNANHEEAMTLANTDAGVALFNGTALVDAVGWGNAANINTGLFEGTPSNGTSQGKSLRRIFELEYKDTNNNLADFYSGIPFLITSFENSQSLSVYAIIEGAAPVISSIVLNDEDPTEQGIQVYPLPKSTKKLFLTVLVADSDANDIDSVTAKFNGSTYLLNKTTVNETSAAFSGYIEIPFYFSPANYSVVIEAMDFSNLKNSANISFTYLSMNGIEFDTTSIVFNALPGKTVQLAGDESMGTQNLTIRNIGNSALDFAVSGTDLVSGSNRINASSIKYTFAGTDYAAASAGILSYSPQHEDVNLLPGEQALKGLSFSLSVPATSQPGNYSGSISIVAETS